MNSPKDLSKLNKEYKSKVEDLQEKQQSNKKAIDEIKSEKLIARETHKILESIVNELYDNYRGNNRFLKKLNAIEGDLEDTHAKAEHEIDDKVTEHQEKEKELRKQEEDCEAEYKREKLKLED